MNKSTTDSFISGISTQSIVTLINSVLQVVVFAVFSRLLSREDFGLYAAIQGVILVLLGISDAGIGSAVIQSKNDKQSFLSTAFSLSLFLGTLVSLVSYFCSGIISDFIGDDKIILPLQILSFIVFIYSLQSYAISVIRKQLNFKLLGICKLLSYIISSSLGIYLAYNGYGVYSLVWLYFADSVIYTFFLFKFVNIPKLGFDKTEAKEIVSFGGYLTLGVIVTNIANQLDKFLLGRFIGVTKLGEYNRPSGFMSNISGLLNTIFDTVLFPILSKFQDSKEHFKSLLFGSSSMLSRLSTVLSVSLFFNSPLIILIFFGSEWMDLVSVLRILSFSAIFLMLNTLCDCFFRSFNLVKIGFYIRVAGLMISAVLLILGSKFGIEGVAVSVLVSNIFFAMMKFVYLCKKSESDFGSIVIEMSKAVVPVLPLCVVGFCFYFLDYNFLNCFVQLAIMGLVLILEAVVFPKILGNEYVNMIYPKIQVVINKFIKK